MARPFDDRIPVGMEPSDLFRALRIEDAALVLELPDGTVAQLRDEDGGVYTAVLSVRRGARLWESVDAGTLTDGEMVGWTAIVPIGRADGS